MSRTPLSRSRSFYFLYTRRHRHRRLHDLFLTSSPSPTIPDLFHSSSSSNRERHSLSDLFRTPSDLARSAVSALAKEILSSSNDHDLASLLASDSARSIIRASAYKYDGFSPFLKLLTLLKPRPQTALQIFHWRRNQPDSPPLTDDEYVSLVSLAGRAHNLALAVKLFYESISTAAHHPFLYNALMSAFMYNGDFINTLCVFDKLKKETRYGPNSVSYNILLSLYSSHTLINQMEAVLDGMDSSGIPRTTDTYNKLICGYLRSKKWDQMERVFWSLKKPDTSTQLLMLRGYANAGRLNKMERMYKLVKEDVHTKERSLIRAMICAYSKVGDQSTLQKIEELLKLVRSEEYFPYFHVLLIKSYAKEGSIDEMERLIGDAYKRNIVISSVKIMRTILSVYFKHGDVGRLDFFIKQAEEGGWSLCKDLYRCKMVLYSRLGQLREMCSEVDKMDSYWPLRDRYTLKILYKGFYNAGKRLEINMVIGLMFKYGFQFPKGAVVQ